MANTAADALALPTTGKNSDIYMALALIGVLSLMIIPLPAFLLDIFLAANITIALVILLVCLYTVQPLDFSVFPSILLVTTLFRGETEPVQRRGRAGRVGVCLHDLLIHRRRRIGGLGERFADVEQRVRRQLVRRERLQELAESQARRRQAPPSQLLQRDLVHLVGARARGVARGAHRNGGARGVHARHGAPGRVVQPAPLLGEQPLAHAVQQRGAAPHAPVPGLRGCVGAAGLKGVGMTWEDVVAIGTRFPEVEEGTCFGTPPAQQPSASAFRC